MEGDLTTLEIQVGALGWRRRDFQGVFYPLDLPREWRLSYYANALPCVLVPPGYWLEGPLPDVAMWREEVPEGFEFHVLVDTRLLQARRWPAIREAMGALGPALGGVVLSGPARAARTAWEALRAVCPPRAKLCVDHDVADPLAPARCWRPGLDGSGAVGLCSLPARVQPRVLRAMLEDFATQGTGPQRVLFLDAPYPVLEQTQMLVRLLGW